MFTWICPKCGTEVPPSYSECPNCAAIAAAKGEANTTPILAQAPEPALAPAPAVRSVPALEERPVSPIPATAVAPVFNPAKRPMPAAVVAVLAMGGIAALLWLVYFVVIPRKAAPIDAQEGGQTAVTATASSSVNPLAKHLEISGVRLSGQGGRAQIQFVIVNHSAAELPELRLNVRLLAADRTVFTFPFTVPSMGPFETRDLSTTVKTNLKPYEWPDWQVLRPQFSVLE